MRKNKRVTAQSSENVFGAITKNVFGFAGEGDRMDTKLLRKTGLSLDREELMVNETLFHNANGYLGVRSNFEEGVPEGVGSIRGEYLNGFYDFADMPQAEKLCGLCEEKQTMLNIADTQTIFLSVDGETFSLFGGEVLESARELDMARGVTRRTVSWKSTQGAAVTVDVTRMASFAMLPLFTIEYRVTAQSDCTLRFSSLHIGSVKNYCDPTDPRLAAEAPQYLHAAPAAISGGASFVTAHTTKSGLSVTSAVKNVLSVPAEESLHAEGSSAEYTAAVSVKAGESVTLTKYTVLCDSVRYDDCRAETEHLLAQAVSVPLSDWYGKQKAYLDQYWETCAVQVEGDDDLSRAVTYNLYQLIQSVGKDPHSNIAAKGLSGEGYEGHYFWDTEMYMLPFFSLTRPDIARNLIEYRHTILPYARENARILGHKKGALYAWRTIMGKECSGYFPSGSAQYHIDGDIAYSVISYYLLTKDVDFLAKTGAEIVCETARLWIDAGSWYKGTFRINDVTGPDEYTCIVNNNYYTNCLAKYNLDWACKFCAILEKAGKLAPLAEKIGLTQDELDEFRRASDAMYLPYDEELDLNPQDDSFLTKKAWDLAATPKEDFPLLLHYHPLYLYRFQVCKQADTVLSHFVMEDYQKLSTMRHSFAYYEKVTTHDSSLSTCIFSIMASRLGMPEKAYDYFGESSKLDLFNTHHNTKDGIHTANMGGTYMAIVYGFGGLRVKESGLCLAPALPAGWTSYRFRVRYEDALIGVRVTKDGGELTLCEGSPKELFLYGKPVTLGKTLPFALNPGWGKE